MGVLQLPTVQPRRPVVTGNVFQLHSCVTTAIFLVCALLTFLVYMVVDPSVECVGGEGGGYTREFANSYCWEVASTRSNNAYAQEGVFVHAYYHLIPFFLVVHGILFYVPRYLWGLLERGRISSIVPAFHQDSNLKPRVHRLTKYLLDSRSNHMFYAASYVVCEFLNFVNAIGNFLLINFYLAGTFVTLGGNLSGSPTQLVFTHQVSCNIDKIAESGHIDSHHFLCHVRISSFCEMMYLFLYCWLVVLMVATALNLLWYGALCVLRPLRKYHLMCRTGLPNTVLNYDQLSYELGIDDFFVLLLLGKNLDTISFQEVLASMTDYSNNAAELEMSPLSKSD